MQHSRFAEVNIGKLTAGQGTDILLLQEPYKIQNKIVGIPKTHKIFIHGVSRPRAAVVVTNNKIDILRIKQLSDSETLVLEVTMDNVKIVLASMYLDINQHIGDNFLKIDAVIQHARGECIIQQWIATQVPPFDTTSRQR